MDFKNRMSGKRDKNQSGERIDARPGSLPLKPAAKGPSSIRETKVWKEGSTEINKAWSNYKTMLSQAFKNMSRADQETFITRLCLIITIGVSMLLYMLIYPFLPLYVRVIALPTVFLASYFAGTKLVAPIIIVRCDEYLNQERFAP